MLFIAPPKPKNFNPNKIVSRTSSVTYFAISFTSFSLSTSVEIFLILLSVFLVNISENDSENTFSIPLKNS